MIDRHWLSELRTNLTELSGRSEDLVNLFFGEASDAVGTAGGLNKETLSHYTKYRLISKYLTHIPVNPHNKMVSQLISNSYVIRQKDQQDSGKKYVNDCSISMTRFMVSLCKSAYEERYYASKEGLSERTVDVLQTPNIKVLHGERGTGKTFALNYLLNRFSSQLNKRKVIWVRINLVYRTPFDDSITDWMMAQCSKIVLRYYDKSSELSENQYVDLFPYLNDWIEQNRDFTNQEKIDKRARLRKMKSAWCRAVTDEPLTYANADIEIAGEIYRYLREIGWSFIFVLDGFDQLDVIPHEFKRFQLVKSTIENFLSNRTAFGSVILIVSRTYTLDNILNNDPFRQISDENKYEIGPVDLIEVAAKRFNAIQNVVLRRSGRSSDYENAELSRFFEMFVKYLNNEGQLEELSKNLVHNTRAKLQALQLIFLDYVNRHTGKGYAVVEQLMLNGRQYPAIAYHYRRIKDSLEPSHAHEISHDSRFLPILTRPPWPLISTEAYERLKKQGDADLILLPLRAVQLTIASDKMENTGPINKAEMLGIMGNVFMIPRPMVEATIVELEAYELLRVERDSSRPADSNYSHIRALPKAGYVVRNFISDVAYLNMCSMRTIFTKEIFRRYHITLASLSDDGSNIKEWVEAKVVNSCVMHAVMLAASSFQHEKVRHRDRNKLSDREKNVFNQAVADGMWTMLPDSTDRFVENLSHVLSPADSRILGFDGDWYEAVFDTIRNTLLNLGRHV